MKIQKEVKHVDAYGIEIQIGDTVKVIAVLPNGSYYLPGFDNIWSPNMNNMLSKTFVVGELTNEGVEDIKGYRYPSFCLEVITEEQIIEDKLQEELNKVFGGDESKMLREYYKKTYLKQD